MTYTLIVEVVKTKCCQNHVCRFCVQDMKEQYVKNVVKLQQQYPRGDNSQLAMLMKQQAFLLSCPYCTQTNVQYEKEKVAQRADTSLSDGRKSEAAGTTGEVRNKSPSQGYSSPDDDETGKLEFIPSTWKSMQKQEERIEWNVRHIQLRKVKSESSLLDQSLDSKRRKWITLSNIRRKRTARVTPDNQSMKEQDEKDELGDDSYDEQLLFRPASSPSILSNRSVFRKNCRRIRPLTLSGDQDVVCADDKKKKMKKMKQQSWKKLPNYFSCCFIV